MIDELLKRYEELIESGEKLVPLGGFEFSGYNARMQPTYSNWRKASLEALELSGPVGVPYKNKIINDSNGTYFYQSSAQLILNSLKELYEKIKATPALITTAEYPPSEAQPTTVAVTESSGAKVLKPPPKKTPTPQTPSSDSASDQRTKVYVIGDKNEPLCIQLSDFLKEIGLEEIKIERKPGTMLELETIQERMDVQYAFFVVNSQDTAYIMFELGHFVGKLGKGHVMVLHMTDVDFPKEVPGVTIKPIVVKLEEASFSIIKELKSLGYAINI